MDIPALEDRHTFQRLKKCLVSEIVTIFKLILVNPATNAVSENTIFCRVKLDTKYASLHAAISRNARSKGIDTFAYTSGAVKGN